ncbi:MAG: hydrogenase maturation protease [Armatimonadetes bacterium]|nr:hydrogenase maturation protease [Armatimonadota bacterium]
MSILIVGVGNALRGDDGAGLAAARRVREKLAARQGAPAGGGGAPAGVPCLDLERITVLELSGGGMSLVEAWEGASLVVVLDAVQTGALPGSIVRVDARAEPLGSLRSGRSSHGVGVAEAVEVARVLGRLPARLIVYGIEGKSFALGADVTPAVARAVEEVALRVLDEVCLS